MAERRMFAKTIISSDAFLDMPTSARLLYYDLGMRADDDGFINSPRSIMRMSGASDDDIKLLIAKKFVIPFESGIVVIKHWNINNYIQKDRYSETKYKEEKSMLEMDENKAYRFPQTDAKCIQDVHTSDTQDRLGKDRLGKVIDIGGVNPPKHKFTPPTLEEVITYCKERKNDIDPDKWYNHYTANGWKVGQNKMIDWKAAVRTWEKSDIGQTAKRKGGNPFLDRLRGAQNE